MNTNEEGASLTVNNTKSTGERGEESGNGDIRQMVDNWFDAHTDDMISDLGRMLAINSVRGPAEDGAPFGAGPRSALALARAMLEGFGFEVSDFEDIIITADLGPSPPLMGILAHLDIVEAGEGWDSDPFEMSIRDGRIYGRGATDNKGPSIASMYAMYCARELCSELQNGCRLILGSGEEVACLDIAQYLEKNEPPPNVFTPDADFPVVNIEKGRIAPIFGASWEKSAALPRVVSIDGGKTANVVPNHAEAVIEGFSAADAGKYCSEFSAKTGAKISARESGGDAVLIAAEGTSSHAAAPGAGLNAQTALVEMLANMPFAESEGFGYIRALNRLFPHGDYLGSAMGMKMSDKLSGDLTLSFNVLSYTETGFSANFDSRTPACADDVDLPGLMREAFEREKVPLDSYTISGCHHTPESSPFVQSLLRIYEDYTGKAGKCLAVGGQTYVHEIPGGVAFGCESEGVSNAIHSVNEYIGIEQLLTSAKMFAMAIISNLGA